LNQIIVHTGDTASGHYFVYFRCNDNWYEYNDKPDSRMSGHNRVSKIIKIGDFSMLLKSTRVTKDCNLLIYSYINPTV
jgi:ubiquitin C-terminal hydrolase